ncbi:MAG: 7,8-didemethyl-8-hydroxy-5-deazariboflavin synthase subunit CofG [Leptolyngbyaceae cyanobacterium]
MVTNASQVVTYSPAITLVPTYECFNRCQYCNFRADPGHDQWLSINDARDRLRQAKSQGFIEALILSGEVHPQSARRHLWLAHIHTLCELALSEGLLPHTNVGPLSYAEMAQLKQVNASMGLMLEQVTPALLDSVHRHAPSKHPEVRLQQLEQAGQLQIPFTTGLLLGIGETRQDRVDTLSAIAQSHHRWGHIQEVIIQPHQPGQSQLSAVPSLPVDLLLETIAMARQRLPADIVLQVPPNLVTDLQGLQSAIARGARDLGGIGPKDEVNPDYSHLAIEQLRSALQNQGWQLQKRLPIYPAYWDWLSKPLQRLAHHWRAEIDQPVQIMDNPPKGSVSPWDHSTHPPGDGSAKAKRATEWGLPESGTLPPVLDV